MKMTPKTPRDGIYPATEDYVHAMEVTGVARFLFVRGTMGLDAGARPIDGWRPHFAFDGKSASDVGELPSAEWPRAISALCPICTPEREVFLRPSFRASIQRRLSTSIHLDRWSRRTVSDEATIASRRDTGHSAA